MIPHFGLQQWTIGVTFVRLEDADAHAACNPSWEYKDAMLYFDLGHERWSDLSVTVVRTVAHELLHCVINPLATAARDNAKDAALVAKIEEMVVTHLERLPFIKELE